MFYLNVVVFVVSFLLNAVQQQLGAESEWARSLLTMGELCGYGPRRNGVVAAVMKR